MAIITQASRGAAEARILEFERLHRLQLPKDYQMFLREFNGGVPEPKTMHVPVLDEDVFVDRLFGIDLEKTFNLETWIREFGDELPKGFLIIGSDPGANLILLGNEQAQPGVFYWDHTHFFPKSNKNGNTYRVSKTFSEFLSSLI